MASLENITDVDIYDSEPVENDRNFQDVIQDIRTGIFDFLGVENVDVSAGNLQVSTTNDTLTVSVNPDTGEPVRTVPAGPFSNIPPIVYIGGGALLLILLLKK